MHHFDVLRKAVERFKNIDREPSSENSMRTPASTPSKCRWRDATPNGRSFSGTTSTTCASLDYLITALIKSAGNEEHDASQFPIYGGERVADILDTEAWWDADPNGNDCPKARWDP